MPAKPEMAGNGKTKKLLMKIELRILITSFDVIRAKKNKIIQLGHFISQPNMLTKTERPLISIVVPEL
jgi:hypothetical protein